MTFEEWWKQHKKTVEEWEIWDIPTLARAAFEAGGKEKNTKEPYQGTLFCKDFTNIELIKDYDGIVFLRGDRGGKTEVIAKIEPAYPDEGASLDIVLPEPNIVIF